MKRLHPQRASKPQGYALTSVIMPGGRAKRAANAEEVNIETLAPHIIKEHERRTLVQAITRDIKTFAEAQKSGDQDSMMIIYLRLKPRMERLETITDLLKSQVNLTTLREISEDYERFFNEFTAMIYRCERIASKAKANDQVGQEHTSTRRNDELAESLPRLKLRTFHGTLSEWEEWWATFEAVVHCSKRLSSVDKLHVLKSYLRGNAQAAVAYLTVTEDNYSKAVEILRTKYDKPDRIKSERVKAIYALQHVDKADDARGLRLLFNRANCMVYSVGNPAERSDFTNALQEALLEKPPLEMQTKWRSKQRKSPRTLKNLLEFIDTWTEDLELTLEATKLRLKGEVRPSNPKTATARPDQKDTREPVSRLLALPPTAV